MAATFLCLRWLQEALTGYPDSFGRHMGRGASILLSPRQFAAALVQSYLGGVSLNRLAQVLGITPETLVAWRREPVFLSTMDAAKAAFAAWFEERLLLTDYTPEQYGDLAGEFALLEDSLKVRLRARLYATLKDLGEGLWSRRRHGLALEPPDLLRFRRLFLLFAALEHFWPSAAARRLREVFFPLARQAVWPALGLAPPKAWEDLLMPPPRGQEDIKEDVLAVLTESLSRLGPVH